MGERPFEGDEPDETSNIDVCEPTFPIVNIYEYMLWR